MKVWRVSFAMLASVVCMWGDARAEQPTSSRDAAKDADMFEPFNQKECDYPAPCGCNCGVGRNKSAQPKAGDPAQGAARPDGR